MDLKKFMKKVFGRLSKLCVKGPFAERLYLWDDTFEVIKITGTLEVGEEDLKDTMAVMDKWGPGKNSWGTFMLTESMEKEGDVWRVEWSFHTLADSWSVPA